MGQGKQTRLRPTSARQEAEIPMKSSRSPLLFPLSVYLVRFSASGRKHSAASRENRLQTPKWGAHPPRVLLDAPRVQPLACATDTEVLEISMRPLFSARARKTAPEAGALPINFGVQV
jgi:hypothetical protein